MHRGASALAFWRSTLGCGKNGQLWCVGKQAQCAVVLFFLVGMVAASSPEFFTAQLDPSGEQCDAWANQPLLHSLEAGRIDWPSSCRNGTCRTCLGQLKSGRVRYEIEWPGLTTEEMEEGCVLPCVAYPASDVVLQDPEN